MKNSKIQMIEDIIEPLVRYGIIFCLSLFVVMLITDLSSRQSLDATTVIVNFFAIVIFITLGVLTWYLSPLFIKGNRNV